MSKTCNRIRVRRTNLFETKAERRINQRRICRKQTEISIRRSILADVSAAVGASAIVVGLMPSTAMAENLLTRHRIPAMLAMEAVTEAVAACAKQGFAVTAMVVDVDGVVQAHLRGDNAPIHTVDGVYGKTYVAASLAPLAKLDTSAAMAARVAGEPSLAGLQFLPHISLIPGGVTIKAGDEVLGAIGVAGGPGGNFDETCARAGLDKIKDRLK